MKVCATCRAKWRGNPSVCPLDGGALEELPDPLIGRTIAGRYVVVERVGSGGMGSVYRARHELVDRDVAIKFLAPELALDATNRQRFLREARAANRIDHEHIIDITDFGETEDGLCFLVMEYLDGGSLADVLRDGPLPARRAVDIGIQIASALARAHELDVIHRDIKPANVVLLRRADHHDFVKLLDFGLAKMKGEIQLTLTGTVFGTPEYMAPEQARGMDLSAKADLYAFGCVLYEMLAGAPPFQGATPDLILKHLRERPERLSSRVPDIDPTLDALVMRLLAKEPSERHADAHHVLEDLRRVAARLPVTSPPRRAPATARAAATEPPTTSVVAGTWESRARFFARLAQRAHPGGAPAWLAAAIAELTAWAKELASMHDEQARATETVMRLEEDVRNGRLRIGKALDVLAEDESRSARRATEIEAEQASAAAELESLEQALRDGLARPLSLPVPLTASSVSRLVTLGEQAGAWLARDAERARLVREMRDVALERDDIRFQIAQLKGRLGTAAAEGELALGEARAHTGRLDARSQELGDRIAARAEEIVKHLLTFPGLADEVRRAQPDVSRPGL